VWEIEITHANQAYLRYGVGRIGLPARRDNRLLYHFGHEAGHLAFYANGRDLVIRRWSEFRWNCTPACRASGYPARVLATGDSWRATRRTRQWLRRALYWRPARTRAASPVV
jgi:hypothetical protein